MDKRNGPPGPQTPDVDDLIFGKDSPSTPSER